MQNSKGIYIFFQGYLHFLAQLYLPVMLLVFEYFGVEDMMQWHIAVKLHIIFVKFSNFNKMKYLYPSLFIRPYYAHDEIILNKDISRCYILLYLDAQKHVIKILMMLLCPHACFCFERNGMLLEVLPYLIFISRHLDLKIELLLCCSIKFHDYFKAVI